MPKDTASLAKLQDEHDDVHLPMSMSDSHNQGTQSTEVKIRLMSTMPVAFQYHTTK